MHRLKRLILLRHAKAVKGFPDFSRPLSDVGETDALESVEALSPFLPDAPCVLASPSVRTRRTAEIAFPDVLVDFKPGLYLAPADFIVAVARRKFDACDTLVVVGHNEGLTDAAALLSDGGFAGRISTSGFCVLDFTVFGENSGKLIHFHVPQRILRAKR